MLADHTDTFTTNSGAPRKALYRDALHPSPKGTLRATSNMWADPDLPFDPKIALPIRHPLLVAACRCWRPLRFSHVLTVRQASTSVQKWASCFSHSRSFPTTTTATTTACRHGKLHGSRRDQKIKRS